MLLHHALDFFAGFVPLRFNQFLLFGETRFVIFRVRLDDRPNFRHDRRTHVFDDAGPDGGNSFMEPVDRDSAGADDSAANDIPSNRFEPLSLLRREYLHGFLKSTMSEAATQDFHCIARASVINCPCDPAGQPGYAGLQPCTESVSCHPALTPAPPEFGDKR
jgi:hypothetical protein